MLLLTPEDRLISKATHFLLKNPNLGKRYPKNKLVIFVILEKGISAC